MEDDPAKPFAFPLPQSLRARLEAYAAERDLSLAGAIRYFIEEGLDGEARRSELARKAKATSTRHRSEEDYAERAQQYLR